MSRHWPRALIVALVVLFLASVSFSCGRTFTVTDWQGAPLPGAYVMYHREGTTYALVEAITYQASRLAILKTNSDGGVAIPWALHVHWPLVQSRPEIAVDLIYAPRLHNGLASVNRRVAVSRPREFAIADDLASARLENVSNDPVLWQESLENLSSILSRLTSQEMRGEETPQLLAELIEQFKGEYAAILARYGEVARTAPEMPVAVRSGTDQEKAAWRAMVDNDLLKRPRWGDEFQRRFATEIRIYQARK